MRERNKLEPNMIYNIIPNNIYKNVNYKNIEKDITVISVWQQGKDKQVESF